MNVLCQLDRGNTLLMTADKVHCHKPLAQGYLGILENRANQHGEIGAATVTAVFTIGAFNAFYATAIGAYNVFTPALLFEHLLAAFLGVEIGD
jgi:hypothetical protein